MTTFYETFEFHTPKKVEDGDEDGLRFAAGKGGLKGSGPFSPGRISKKILFTGIRTGLGSGEDDFELVLKTVKTDPALPFLRR